MTRLTFGAHPQKGCFFEPETARSGDLHPRALRSLPRLLRKFRRKRTTQSEMRKIIEGFSVGEHSRIQSVVKDIERRASFGYIQVDNVGFREPMDAGELDPEWLKVLEDVLDGYRGYFHGGQKRPRRQKRDVSFWAPDRGRGVAQEIEYRPKRSGNVAHKGNRSPARWFGV